MSDSCQPFFKQLQFMNAGRFEDDFVSQRLQHLQRWVDRMCRHPVVAQSDVFHHFLTCADDKVTKTTVYQSKFL